jgi:hypothetical protein
MRRWLASLVALAIAGCGSTPMTPGTRPAPSATASAPTASSAPAASSAATTAAGEETREGRLIARMLKRVTGVRGIEATNPVPGVVLSRAKLIARVKDHVSQEIPPEAIRNEGLVLQLFGFVPTQFDYEAAEYSLLEAQLAGYYEPADGTMYMASDLGNEEANATLAHELVHALQDQHWDLKSRSKYRPGEGDKSTAISALAEGDATSAMVDVMFARAAAGRTALDLQEQIFTEQIRQGMNSGPTATAPNVMRSSLVAPYIYGTLFVHALRRKGGWDAVNRAWDDPPVTSEQILHVDKWESHETAIAVTAPTAAALGASWSMADADTYGELGARLAWEEWLDAPLAASASEGWGGDRGVLFKSGERAAFAWRLRYDAGAAAPDDRAKRAFAVVAPALESRVGKAATKEPGAFVCVSRKDRGPLALARFGRDLVLVAGPARTGAQWVSEGDCALARKWTHEIGAAP